MKKTSYDPRRTVQDSGYSGRNHDYLPLLDLVESLQLGNGDEDNDGLLAALDVDLTSRRDLEGSQLGLDLRDVVLQVQESLGDLLLNLGGGSARGVGRAAMSATLEGGTSALCSSRTLVLEDNFLISS